MRKKLFLIGGAGIILAFVIFILVQPAGKKQNPPVQTVAPKSLESVPNNYYWTQKTREASKRSYAVGELIDKLPYKSANFSMNYDINEDLFIVVLNSENVALANKEFDLFLSENKIGDKSWIKNLVIKREVLRP